MVKGPMILTGFQALNKLLGQQVFTTQDQLGGPHIMVPNGVTHELVSNDQSGVEAILRWLAFIPCTTTSIPRVLMSRDSINREVALLPSGRILPVVLFPDISIRSQNIQQVLDQHRIY